MRIDERTKEVTLTQAEYVELTNKQNNQLPKWKKRPIGGCALSCERWHEYHKADEICNNCEARHDKDKCDGLVFGKSCPLQKRNNSELTEFEKEVKGILFDAGDKYNLNDDLDKATKDLAPHFLEAARKQFVEEACNWLYDMWPQIAESPQFIEDFRKALEKGVKDE